MSKKIATIVMLLVSLALTACSSAPAPKEYQPQPIVIYQQQPAVVYQQPIVVYQTRPMYAPSNVFVQVPGQPPRTTGGVYYQYR